MRNQTIRMHVAMIALVAIVATAAPAAAQITRGGTTGLPWASRWDVAHDGVNQIYLLLADGQPASRIPVRGQFLDGNGNYIGGMFNITDEFASNGEAPSWATVTFGGPPEDPVFLVTYVVPLEGNAIPKYGRLVRFRGGVPIVSPRTMIYPNLGGEWFAADRARPAWNGQRFIVPTRVPGGAVGSVYAQPVFSFFDLNGVSSGGVNMGNGLDYQGGPSVSCGAGNVCMAAGFAAGAPVGGVGGIWARLFNGLTLQPITDVFYPDDHSTFMDTPHVVFNANTGQFNLIWYRRAPGTGAIDFRVVNTNGALGPLDLTRSFTIYPGEPGLAYNPVSRSSLLVTKWGQGADLYALELGDDGYPRNLANAVEITRWDGRVLEYRPAVIGSQTAGQWLVTFNLGASSGVAAVYGGVGQPPPPPPPPPPATPDTRMYLDAPLNSGTVAGPLLTISGWALDLNAPTGNGVDAVHAYAFPVTGGHIFLGTATFVPRLDVATHFGQSRFNNSGFVLANFLPPGVYNIGVYAHSTVTGTFTAVWTVQIRVTPPPNPQMSLDQPAPGWPSVPSTFFIRGWAVDLASFEGSGVDAVHAWAYPIVGAGYGTPVWLGPATVGTYRGDVAAYFGSALFANSGFELVASLPPGVYDLVVYARSWIAGSFNNWRTVRITVP
jgi:hypothetical protein